MPKNFPISVTAKDAQAEFCLKSSSTGQQLLLQFCTTLGIREMWYFGLQYTDHKGRQLWLKTNKRIGSTFSHKETPLKFTFKVKYFPEDVSEELIEDITKSYFYHDVKESIVSGRVYCPMETAVLLASYQALINHGRYDPSHQTGFLNISKYLPPGVRNQCDVSDEQWEEKIVKFYIAHEDMSKEEAIVEYLKIAQDLEMFGVNYFKIKNNKDTDLWLGVDAFGLNIYEFDNQLNPKISFPWNEIHKLSFVRNKFSVKPVDTTAKSFTFITDSVHSCKTILNLSTGNHELYGLRRQPDSIEVQQMKIKAREQQNIREAERGKLRAEREARKLIEQRYREMERAMQEAEKANARTQSVLEDYEMRVSDLHMQLEEEQRARQRLEEMQRQMEEVNRCLEMQSAEAIDERSRLAAERDAVRQKIEEQTRLLSEREKEMSAAKAELERARLEREKQLNNAKEDSNECVLHNIPIQDECVRQTKADTDLDYAQRLKLLREDLNALRDAQKMRPADVQHEENVQKGMDKFRTLRAIRLGNTKKRVDQFESM